MNELALFAGAGGGILGSHLLGWRTVAAVEIEDYPRRVLLQRQADGILPKFPIWDDVCTFDGKPWRGKVDIITGGFPCQDISVAGKGAGITGERSGLWGEMSRIIGEVRPNYVLVENSPALTFRGLGTVLRDLAQMGFDAKWGVLGADDAGAPHRRKRIWILANAIKNRLQAPRTEQQTAGIAGDGERSGNMADANTERLEINQQRESNELKAIVRSSWWDADPADGPTESKMGRVAYGVANRVDRLAAIGNGQVPAVVELAWKILGENNDRR